MTQPIKDEQLIEVRDIPNGVELIYKEFNFDIHVFSIPSKIKQKVYKIVYSCKDGQFHKSEKIYGKINPPKETYTFEDSEKTKDISEIAEKLNIKTFYPFPLTVVYKNEDHNKPAS